MFRINFDEITNFVKKSFLKYISFPLANKITVKIIINYCFLNFENMFCLAQNNSKYLSDIHKLYLLQEYKKLYLK